MNPFCGWGFKSTRVRVCALFESLEDGAAVNDLLAWFPVMLFGVLWRPELARVGHGRRIPLMNVPSIGAIPCCGMEITTPWPRRLRRQKLLTRKPAWMGGCLPPHCRHKYLMLRHFRSGPCLLPLPPSSFVLMISSFLPRPVSRRCCPGAVPLEPVCSHVVRVTLCGCGTSEVYFCVTIWGCGT